MKIPKVDPDKCTGCGTCFTLCPDFFELGDDGKSQVIPDDEYDEIMVQDAIDGCPEQAISWEEK